METLLTSSLLIELHQEHGENQITSGAAVFLSSKASDFVNGQIIYVDGGI